MREVSARDGESEKRGGAAGGAGQGGGGVMRGKLLTVREVADWLSISEAWVRHHATGRRHPAVPSIRLGKSLRFNEATVSQWLEEMARLAASREGRAA